VVKTLVVGDVQGCADELEDLLAAVGFSSGEDHLVSVGDLINRGPKSLAVLQLVRRVGGDLVLGNHELHLLEVAAGLRQPVHDTFGDVLATPELPELLDWLVNRPEPLMLIRDWVVVHAGLPPRFVLPDEARTANEAVRARWQSAEPLAQRVAAIVADPTVRFLTRVRYCNALGETPPDEDEPDPAGYEPWFEYRQPGPRIAFGHWARLNPMRARRPDLRFLDTGCVYGGRLTGWLVEEDRLISVPARRAYWPPAV
jgi:bis(5'-nucleosyl)-tetraphosphatase (symmetrical)